MKRFLPNVKVFQNTILLPSLPCVDGYFSLVYAFSVFTHIDEWELAWLLEVRRLLKEGSIAYVSQHQKPVGP